MRTRSSILLLMAGLLQSAAGQVLSTTQASGIHEQRRQEYLELSKKIFADIGTSDAAKQAVNNLPAAQVDEITGRLHDLAVAEVEDVLAGKNPTAPDVVKVRNLLGEASLATWGAQATNTPFAAFIPLGGSKVLAAALEFSGVAPPFPTPIRISNSTRRKTGYGD